MCSYHSRDLREALVSCCKLSKIWSLLLNLEYHCPIQPAIPTVKYIYLYRRFEVEVVKAMNFRILELMFLQRLCSPLSVCYVCVFFFSIFGIRLPQAYLQIYKSNGGWTEGEAGSPIHFFPHAKCLECMESFCLSGEQSEKCLQSLRCETYWPHCQQGVVPLNRFTMPSNWHRFSTDLC